MAMRCVAAFAAFDGRVPTIVNVGDVLADDDPIVRGREVNFESLDTHLARRNGVESATAAPGEKRSLSSRKSAAKKPAG
ncbi:hypothetical protein [Streptomyces sp. NPDC002346]